MFLSFANFVSHDVTGLEFVQNWYAFWFRRWDQREPTFSYWSLNILLCLISIGFGLAAGCKDCVQRSMDRYDIGYVSYIVHKATKAKLGGLSEKVL